eukprot:2904751-Pyramimonas_sp.AAC.1
MAASRSPMAAAWASSALSSACPLARPCLTSFARALPAPWSALGRGVSAFLRSASAASAAESLRRS